MPVQFWSSWWMNKPKTNMARELVATRPLIYSGNGNLKVQWYVHYSFKNPWTGKMDRFKYSDGINCNSTIRERMDAAKSLQARWWRKLKAGYNPFDSPDHIYSSAQKQLIFNKDSIQEILLDTIPKVTQSIEKKTLTTYKRYVLNFCEWLKTKGKIDLDISLITEDDAENFLTHLLEAKGHGTKHRNEHLSLLRKLFEYLKRRKKITDNPFFFCVNKKVESKGRKFYRDGIRNLIIDELEKRPQLLLFCEMIYYTLARPKELRFMQLSEIFLTDARIEIPGNKSKTDMQRWITIPEQLLKKLYEMKLHEYPKEFYLFGNKGVPASKPTGVNYFRKKYIPIKLMFSLGRDYGIYNWKHTGAIKADRANIPHKDIQQQGGWTTMAMLDTYLGDMDTIDSPYIRNQFPDIRSTTGSTRSV